MYMTKKPQSFVFHDVKLTWARFESQFGGALVAYCRQKIILPGMAPSKSLSPTDSLRLPVVRFKWEFTYKNWQ